MKALTVFKKLIIRTDSTYYHKMRIAQAHFGDDRRRLQDFPHIDWLIPDHIPSKNMNVWLSEEDVNNDHRNGDIFLHAIREKLEPVLGRCMEGDVQGAHNVVFSRFLEFHPRESLKSNHEAESLLGKRTSLQTTSSDRSENFHSSPMLGMEKEGK